MVAVAVLVGAVATAPVWTLANKSNVYGVSYKSKNVHQATAAGSKEFTDELACRSACASEPTCLSYTWTKGPQPGVEPGKCRYTHECWWRDDDVWDLKATSNCAGRSGYKGIPQSPTPAPTPQPPPPPPPAPAGALNVLFVIYDDLRVMQHTYGFTPESGGNMVNFDTLAKRSLIFDNAYCQQAVCGPSRASLLSGRRPDTTQMWNFVGGFRQTPGADKWNTWPEWFRKKGYYSAGSGKLWHPGDPKDEDPPSWSGGQYGGYHGQDSCPSGLQQGHGCPIPDGVQHDFPDYKTLNTAKQQLAQAAANRSIPFWIGVGFVKPHMPHVFPAKFLNAVPPQSKIQLAKHMTPPSGIAAELDWQTNAEGPVKDANVNTPADNTTQLDWRQNYYAAAAFSDSILGELLAELDAHNFTDNTIVVLTSDHGWGLGELNHWVKYTNFEMDARVPLLVHLPNAAHTYGVHTKSLVEHVDLYPTIAELAGVPVLPSAKESIEGSSYASLFAPNSDPGSTVWTNSHNGSFTQYPRCGEGVAPDGTPTFENLKRCASVSKNDFVYMGYSIRTQEWRYTEWALWNGTTLRPKWFDDVTAENAIVELYDHRGDVPGIGQRVWDEFENENVASANLEVVRELSTRVRAFYDRVEELRGMPYGV
eukprot:Hpha_TRINITY_DN18529_c0_g1::TRINITY_DN18529_c0_g1_i1::g.195211::m.195211/K01136/IDS; iduronate 2-sulfatase